jgi:hypothetical protein
VDFAALESVLTRRLAAQRQAVEARLRERAHG